MRSSGYWWRDGHAVHHAKFDSELIADIHPVSYDLSDVICDAICDAYYQFQLLSLAELHTDDVAQLLRLCIVELNIFRVAVAQQQSHQELDQ